jgi:hypothetical protein
MTRYALTIFTSAFLLFGVQPLVGKYALPWFGGTPAVWTACMLFFQALLLAGYAYAHLVATRLSPRRQAQVHLGLLAVTVGALAVRTLLMGSPVAPAPEWRPEGADVSVFRLLAMLGVSIGLPFFLLSTTGPLLQSWFSRARPGASPYRLYALSNTGSLLSLLGYPFLVEPFVSRAAQGRGWGVGFLLFAAACAACAMGLLRGPAQAPKAMTEAAPSQQASAEAPRPGVGRTLAWLGLSACASVVLLAATNQLSQDVAAGPFLWVMPLALYLLTFILAFEREALYSRGFFSVLLLVSVLGITRAMQEGPHFPLALQLLSHGGALFAGCMLCHGELYRLRPAPRHLSAFYLWVSVGGVLGGAFVSLVAPRVFATYLEYPLALGACCLVALGGALRAPEGEGLAGRVGRQARGVLVGAVLLGLGVTVADGGADVRLTARNFFGVVQVLETDRDDAQLHQYSLRHGVITHGLQYARPERRGLPTSYYTPDSGLGVAIAEQRRLKEAQGQAPTLRLGVLGLGVGTTAALARGGDTLRFYEINPDVIALARGEGGYFSFLTDTPGTVEMVEGDARISLEQEAARGTPGRFDVLALDVFSSDSIPVHLLTEEAMALYLQHLAPGGVLVMHVSNVHLDLVPVVVAHAARFGLHATAVLTRTQGEALSSRWVVLSAEEGFARGAAFSEAPSQVARLTLRGAPTVTWTDDLSSVLPVVRRLAPRDSVDVTVLKAHGTPVASPGVP